ncbi:MAG: hypothetical protein U0175_01155 [Caldilineaceae bacterium]
MYIQNDIDTMKMLIEQRHKELREESEIRHLLWLQQGQQNSISPVTWVGDLLHRVYSRLIRHERPIEVVTGQQNCV